MKHGETIAWRDNALVLIDQTRLPGKLVYKRCTTARQVWQAIRTLQVRGAPAIGAAAAFGMVLGLRGGRHPSRAAVLRQVDALHAYLSGARPTAVNLFWALDRMRRRAQASADRHSPAAIREILLREAQAIAEEDRRNCRAMAAQGQALVPQRARILTVCNTGALATIDYGTALGVVYRAAELRKRITVYACETRPLLQGARLTCWELLRRKIDVTLICDNMAAYLMQQKKIDCVFIGADRIAANGDTANKIGSYSLAVAARFHKIPFYVAAPRSTIDPAVPSRAGIVIEERAAEEVRRVCGGPLIAPPDVPVYNPAFDTVPAALISAIVTEAGVARPPYRTAIRKLLRR
ncbi:MAG: S-methyl-5-thioribose-1-phosphate isomerase [Candidatus Omnitrophica bacterium]|nr:S-methyl-5-thioribose-1-phosphate isomerase [Candidatus Omnitrophota bacterium]